MSTVKSIIKNLLDYNLNKNIVGYVKDSEGNYKKIIFTGTVVDYEDDTNEIGMLFEMEESK